MAVSLSNDEIRDLILRVHYTGKMITRNEYRVFNSANISGEGRWTIVRTDEWCAWYIVGKGGTIRFDDAAVDTWGDVPSRFSFNIPTHI